MEIGTSEAEPIWTEFLRKLTRRGLRDVKLVVSDAHEGIKAAIGVYTWQRCLSGLRREGGGETTRRPCLPACASHARTPYGQSEIWRRRVGCLTRCDELE
jgi:putative transposase